MASFAERLKARLQTQALIQWIGEKRTVARIPVPSVGELQARTLRQQADDRPLTWIVSPEDWAVIGRIVDRAIEIGNAQKPPVFIDHRLACMDIVCVHANGCPLKLVDFMLGETLDFVEDFGGIGMHVNRRTGGFHHGWWPKHYARNPK